MPDMNYREQLDQQRLQTIRDMLLTLPRSCADFIRSLQATTSMLTRLAYTIDLTTFFTFVMHEIPGIAASNATEITDADIAALKPRDIEIYAEYLSLYFKQDSEDAALQHELRNQTYGIMRKLSSLRSFFNYLFRTQRIPANIVSLVPLPKLHDKPILLLEREEMHRLLQTIETGAQLTPQQAAFHKITQVRDMAITMLFLGTGVRVSECVGINLEDIDWKVNALLVTRKGGNQVILYFPKEVADALKAYLTQRESMKAAQGHEHAFFLSLQRKRITQRAVELMIKKYAMLVVPLKRRMSPHKLRSTYATNLYEATQDIYLVAETLGHADVNTTRKHYASMSAARMRQAASHTRLRDDTDTAPADEQPSTPPKEAEQYPNPEAEIKPVASLIDTSDDEPSAVELPQTQAQEDLTRLPHRAGRVRRTNRY
ncbi:MAG: tyrosine-type recombinase/integrase [Candidatus Limiplasma sp.]|nr:tyrosine-type recombinase/integrase [Candidatus Limiplasma sp.]